MEEKYGHPICREPTGEDIASNSHPSGEGSMLTEETRDDLKSSLNERLEKGHLEYGCPHYRRRCRIRAPCCNEVFDCRHCHNEVKNSIDVETNHRHEISRQEVQQVICSLCGTEQEVRQVCINCGVCMGKYFCETCKFFDDDNLKKQFHCSGCGICRIGGRENFFHCYKCRCCYSNHVKNSHPCIEGAMHHDCPVCFEYLFDSTNVVSVLSCGHTLHVHCLKEMQQHFQFACPLCSRSVCDMSKVWEKLDIEVAATPMPERYQNKKVCVSIRFAYCVMTVAQTQKSSIMLLGRSASTASLTILARLNTWRIKDINLLVRNLYLCQLSQILI